MKSAGIFRVILIFIWTGLMVPLSLILRVVFANHTIPLIMARNQWGKVVLWLAGVRLIVSGVNKIAFGEPRIYIANHSSYLDIPCLFVALPINLYFIAKAEVKKIPFVGFFMKATKMIFLDRSGGKTAIESMNKSADLIKAGKSVLVFPEGTRSLDGEIKSFKKGAFVLARNANIPVVPIGLKGAELALPPDSFVIRPHKVVLEVGAPILGENFDNVESFIEEVRNQTILLRKGH